jgi:hypothetical protein
MVKLGNSLIDQINNMRIIQNNKHEHKNELLMQGFMKVKIGKIIVDSIGISKVNCYPLRVVRYER